MKVTNELKDYIYNELKKQLTKGPEYKAQYELNCQTAMDELRQSPEFCTYQAACDTVNNKVRAMVDQYEGVALRSLFNKDSGLFMFEVDRGLLRGEVEDKMTKILARISYAKNQDEVLAILKEYDIEL